MKKICPIVICALFVVLSGVSCTNEMRVSGCNLKTIGRGLETSVAVYQYSVVKDSGPNSGTVCDWTDFDINSTLLLDDLPKGFYTFHVRGLSKSKAVVCAGSEQAFLSGSSVKNITVTLYPLIDETITNKINIKLSLPNSASDGLTAKAICKNSKTGVEINKSLIKSGSEFSYEFSLIPGYYEISVFVFQNNVEVGGSIEYVFLPTGCDQTIVFTINPRSISGIINIRENSTVTVANGSSVTMAWVGEKPAEGKGVWKIGSTVVESNAMYCNLPTENPGTYTVKYCIGDTVLKACDVTIGQTCYTSILNFRSASSDGAVVGYRDKTTKEKINMSPIEVFVTDGFDPTDYNALNLEPIIGTLSGSTFAEISKANDLTQLKYYGGTSVNAKNNTIKTLIINGSVAANAINGKLTALETLIIDKPAKIDSNALKNLTSLKNVYIIATEGTSLLGSVFNGCTSLENVYIVGEESDVTINSSCFSGSNITRDDVVFIPELPW